MNKIVPKTISLPVWLILFIFFSFCWSCQSVRTAQNLRLQENQTREAVVKQARKLLGTKYRYAGKSPRGFDCSGFTGYIYKKEGIKLSDSSRAQSKQGDYREIREARPGDLVFFGPPFKIDHVGIVSQNKKGKLFVIHSTNSQGVVEEDVFQILYWKKRLKFARDVISP